MTDLVSPTLPQVQTEHYRPAHYDQFHRWVSYWYQIQSIARTGAKTVLEIGVGSGVVSSYLRSRLNRFGLNVEAICDARSAGLIEAIRSLSGCVWGSRAGPAAAAGRCEAGRPPPPDRGPEGRRSALRPPAFGHGFVPPCAGCCWEEG